MKGLALVSALVAALGTVSATPTQTDKEPPSKRADFPKVSVSGNAFWAGKERFYLRGIDYQPGGSSLNADPIADPKICKRDVAKFKKLGINCARVYSVDNSKDHTECMNELKAAGIYLVVDVNTPKYSLNRADPFPSYNAKYLQSVFATVDEFARYDNTLAFFSGNEVINDNDGTDKSAPYVKAVTRDIKNYMNSHGLRHVPVGYSAADVASNRMQTAMYMNCGTDAVRSDFFAFNDYSWCNSNFEVSGWDQKVKNFTDYGLPIFLSEWGCITNGKRTFGEMSALMSEKMSAVYSGGLMYEYSVEGNDYGIVELKGDSVVETVEFQPFADALKANPAPAGSGNAATTTHAVNCPPSDPATWNVNPSLVPDMPEQAQQYMKGRVGPGPGLTGDGSQDAVDSGTSAANSTGGQASPTSSSKDEDNAGVSIHGPMDKEPLVVSCLALFFTLFGALLL